jgi:hypothetical protein
MVNPKSRISLAAAALACSLLPAAAAQADKVNDKPAPQAAAAPNGTKSGVMVFIDPATHKIRRPQPGEMRDLMRNAGRGAAARRGVLPPAPSQPIFFEGPAGSIGALLDEGSMSYMTVEKSPDGKLSMKCVESGKEKAARVSVAPQPAKKVLDEK